MAAILGSLQRESETCRKQQVVAFGRSYTEYRNLLINWLVVKAEECELAKIT